MNACTNCKIELTNSGLCVKCQREYDDFCEYLHNEEVREEESRWRQVSKEMAIDAGDRSLEGQCVRLS